MKKIMLLAAILAMTLVVAAPAMAQVEEDFDQESDSGDVDQSFTITSSGSNGSSCTPISGSSQSGNVQTSDGFVQSDESEIEEFEQDEVGSDLTLNSNNSTECKQEVNQAASAGSPKAAPAPAPAPAPAGSQGCAGPGPRSEGCAGPGSGSGSRPQG